MIKKLLSLILSGSILLSIINCEKKVENITPSPKVEEKTSPPMEKKAPPPQEEPAPKIFEEEIEEENIPAD